MGAEWLVFGAVAALDELGGHIRGRSAKKRQASNVAVAKTMQCTPEFESEINRQVADPSKSNEVWERIESFKRENPHLCLSEEWGSVGKNRYPLASAKMSHQAAIVTSRAMTARLLCRTYGRLMPDHAMWIASRLSYYRMRLSFGYNPLVHPAKSLLDRDGYRKEQQLYRDLLLARREELFQKVRDDRDEEHDAIVYMSSLEFDPCKEEAVKYVTASILNKAVPDEYSKPEDMPDGVCAAITREEYEKFIASGGEDDPFISQSIIDREAREAEAKRRFIGYVPDGTQFAKIVNDIAWKHYLLSLPEDTMVESKAARFWGNLKDELVDLFFDGSVLGILMLLLSFVAIVQTIISFVDLFS